MTLATRRRSPRVCLYDGQLEVCSPFHLQNASVQRTNFQQIDTTA